MPNLHLGDVAPDFEQDSSLGRIHFHEWIGDSWAVLFSHPADFTPVCTKELGLTAKLKGEFAKRGVKVIALSVDPVESHKKWIEDIDSSQDSLQLTDNYSVATPGNWKHGNDVVILPSVQDPEVIKQKFPKGYVAVRPYLRITPQPNWHDHDEISRSG